MAQQLADETGQAFSGAEQVRRRSRRTTRWSRVSAALRTLAGALMKIANDVRWLASGPRTGIGELPIPENEPGSSIMPGKVNPTQSEAMTMVVTRVFGNDATVGFAGRQGNFQLNVFTPVMAHAVLESIRLLADACRLVRPSTASRGIEPNRERIAAHLERPHARDGAGAAHRLRPAAAIAKQAHRDGTTLREAAVALGDVTEDDFDRLGAPGADDPPRLKGLRPAPGSAILVTRMKAFCAVTVGLAVLIGAGLAPAATPAGKAPPATKPADEKLPDRGHAEVDGRPGRDGQAPPGSGPWWVFSRDQYFLDKGQQHGVAYEAVRAFENSFNAKRKLKNLKVHVGLRPDLARRPSPRAAGGTRRHRRRRAHRDAGAAEAGGLHGAGTARGVSEIAVTGPHAPALASVEDLSGKEVLPAPPPAIRSA